MSHTTIPIRGMHCASCALVIEKKLSKQKGVANANVNYALERASVSFDDTVVKEQDLEQVIRNTGYEVEARSEGRGVKPEAMAAMHDASHHGTVSATANDRSPIARLVFSMVLTTPLILGMIWMPNLGMISDISIFTIVSGICAWILVAIIGFPFHRGTWNELKHGRANMDTLVTTGTSAALLWSTYALFTGKETYFEVAGFIITFLTLGRYLEARQRLQAGEAINALLHLHPKLAHQQHADGTIEDVDPQTLHPGDLCLVKPGERIPIDGAIVTGSSTIDESMLTGEPIPAERQKGDMVYAATINGTGSFTMSVTTEPGKTMLDAIISTVEHALTTKSPVERVVDRVSSIFVPSVILIAILTFLAWLLISKNPAEAIRIGVAVLIVACPCAMGLATPAAIIVGTGRGAKEGILIKDGGALEAAKNIDVVLFDKTGTLTEGAPNVTDLIEQKEDAVRSFELLQIAGALESHSEHPLASAILRHINAIHPNDIHIPVIQHVEAVVGKGLKGSLEGSRVSLGTESFMREQGIDIPSDIAMRIESLRREAKTIVFVARETMLIGAIAIQDRVKQEAKEAIRHLEALGISPGLVTGDHLATANAVADALQIKQLIFAGVTPNRKAEIIRELQSEGKRVAFVGDGINDAPALATATLGIAIGTGTDIAIATGQIVIMKGSPLKSVEAIRLSRSTFKTIKQNLFWAFIYNVIGIPLAALGVLNPVLASAAMAMSSVSVLGNSLRVRHEK